MLFGKSQGHVEALVFDSMYKIGALLVAGLALKAYIHSFFFLFFAIFCHSFISLYHEGQFFLDCFCVGYGCAGAPLPCSSHY